MGAALQSVKRIVVPWGGIAGYVTLAIFFLVFSIAAVSGASVQVGESDQSTESVKTEIEDIRGDVAEEYDIESVRERAEFKLVVEPVLVATIIVAKFGVDFGYAAPWAVKPLATVAPVVSTIIIAIPIVKSLNQVFR